MVQKDSPLGIGKSPNYLLKIGDKIECPFGVRLDGSLVFSRFADCTHFVPQGCAILIFEKRGRRFPIRGAFRKIPQTRIGGYSNVRKESKSNLQ